MFGVAVFGLGATLVGGLVPLFGNSQYFPAVIAAAGIQMGAIVIANSKKSE